MKVTEQVKELRAMGVDELQKVVESTQQEIMNLRFRQAAGQLQHTAQFESLRRKVARAKTVIVEKKAH